MRRKRKTWAQAAEKKLIQRAVIKKRKAQQARDEVPKPAVVPGSLSSQIRVLRTMDKAQQRRLIGQIGSEHGNQHVQRLVGELRSSETAPVQRHTEEPQGVTSARYAENKGAPEPDEETKWSGSKSGATQKALTPEQKKEDLKSPQLASDERLQKAYDNSPVLRQGATGEAVKKVQQALLDDGIPLPISTRKTGKPDGIFGKETLAAVRKYQDIHGLDTDGLVGRKTLGKMDELYGGGGGKGGGGGGKGGGGGGKVVKAALSATLAVAGNESYIDTAVKSRKHVKFQVGWKGGRKEDYVVVNWLKGYMKNSKGKPYKVSMYGSLVDFNFADWRVDSIDPDPVYWSEPNKRWGYTVDGESKFHATDDPGPMNTTDGAGAEAKVDFKVAVYKSADVPKTTKGALAATPITSFVPWTYHVRVLGGGKFKHIFK